MRCGACGAPTRPSARFCDQCGAPLDATGGADRATRPREDVESGDRRIVTALFADLVDYVRLVAEHDPEDVRRKVDAALRAMVEAIKAYDGTREKFIGDAVFAVFGWPAGPRRRRPAGRSLRAGDPRGGGPRDRRRRRSQASRSRSISGSRPARSSPVSARDDALDWSLTGPAVTTAARIQGIARPNEILLDEATVHAARKGLDVEDEGPQLLRGPDPARSASSASSARRRSSRGGRRSGRSSAGRRSGAVCGPSSMASWPAAARRSSSTARPGWASRA